MRTTGPERGWHYPEQPRVVILKQREPLAIYDLTKRQGSLFFSYLGKFAALCIVGLVIYSIVVWAVHGHPSPNNPSANAEDNSSPGEFAVSPVVEAAPAQAPKLGYVASWGITANSATVSWSTDKPSTTQLAYGTSPSFGQMSSKQTKLDVTHGVKLSDLKSGTTYYIMAQSADKDGVVGYSTTYSFKTLSAQAGPALSGIVVVPGKNNQVQISWKTSIPTYSFVQLGPTTAYNRFSTRTDLTTNPHPAIAWVPSGTVHYQLVSTDAAGNKTVSPDYTFIEP